MKIIELFEDTAFINAMSHQVKRDLDAILSGKPGFSKSVALPIASSSPIAFVGFSLVDGATNKQAEALMKLISKYANDNFGGGLGIAYNAWISHDGKGNPYAINVKLEATE